MLSIQLGKEYSTSVYVQYSMWLRTMRVGTRHAPRAGPDAPGVGEMLRAEPSGVTHPDPITGTAGGARRMVCSEGATCRRAPTGAKGRGEGAL